MAIVDPVTLSVLWGGLTAVCEQMGTVQRRSAYSVAFREARDHSAALTDAGGRLIAQGNFSPAHLGSFPFVIKHVLDAYPPDTLEPGDVVLLNDSAMGSGHLLDFILAAPIFCNDQLAAFSLSCGHMVDIGGAGAGSQAVNVMDFYQEGIRFLPTKLYSKGEPNEELFKVLAANVRIPDTVQGDVRALRNGLRLGELGFQELVANYGLETMQVCSDEILRRSEERMREAILEIPDGEYTAEDYYDDCGEGTAPLKIKVTVRVNGSDIIYDFTGSSPQTSSGINAYINYTRAFCIFVTKCLTLRDTWPQNEGCVRPIQVVAPKGSLFNAQYPAGGGARALMGQRLVETVMQALAPALPDRVIASHANWGNPNLGGVDPKTGRQFVYYDMLIGGGGPSSMQDGAQGYGVVINNTNIPIEVAESMNPILVERAELVQDTEGPGCYRGGNALRKDIRMLADDLTYSNLTDGHVFPRRGLFGGQAGGLGTTVLNPGTPQERRLHSKGVYSLREGDVLSNILSGSGGYRDPLERDPEAVLNDVRDGYVSIEGAARRYGVVVDPVVLQVQKPDTFRLRSRPNTQS